MTPKERARATLAKRGDDVEAFLRARGRGEDPPCPGGVEAYLASAIRDAEDEAWNAALLAAAREVNTVDGDPDLIVKSLLRRPPGAPGGERP